MSPVIFTKVKVQNINGKTKEMRRNAKKPYKLMAILLKM
jgi:hypothetical protein